MICPTVTQGRFGCAPLGNAVAPSVRSAAVSSTRWMDGVTGGRVEVELHGNVSLLVAATEWRRATTRPGRAKPYQERPAVAPRSPAPLTIKDQADLRWLLSQDWQWLVLQAAMLRPPDQPAPTGTICRGCPMLSSGSGPRCRWRSWRRSPSNGGNDTAATSTIKPRSSLSLNCCRAGVPPDGEVAHRMRRTDQHPQTGIRVGPNPDRWHRRSKDLDRPRRPGPQPGQDRRPHRLKTAETETASPRLTPGRGPPTAPQPTSGLFQVEVINHQP